jgi:DMSO/TMAO reductase YedYZ heme-binding membrane subunit
LGVKASWYLMRGSGFVALGMLTLTMCLGIANVTRWQRGRWTRAVVALVHRNASLLAVVFLAIHVITAVTDNYVSISPLAALVPGLSGYDPLWIGMAAVAVDITLALIVTSLLRARLGRRAWRAVHWLSYLAWPTALVHAIGAGSGRGVDSGHVWSTAIYITTVGAMAIALAARIRTRRRPVLPAKPLPASPDGAVSNGRPLPALSGRFS